MDIIRKWALKNAVEHEGKAVTGAVINKVMGEDPGAMKDMKALALKINATVKEINALPLETQKKELLKMWPAALEKKVEEKRVLPELPNAVPEKMVFRFAPYPSGALHLGNAKTYMLNVLYAEKYRSKLLFVMDDTIGSEEKQIVPEAYKLIEEGFRWLGVRWDGDIVYKSDRLEIYYKHAAELIRKDYAYVCTCPVKTLRANREKGKACKCRKQTPNQADMEWGKMLTGEYKEGEAALRLKTDMKHPNPAFRDRVLFRISKREHPRTGKKYSVWPMLEFSWAVDDHELGVTHVLRGKDLLMESEMCKFIWHALGWESPTLMHTGLIRIEGAKMAKSKSQKEIKSGAFEGWDDPRTWSLQALRRRGIAPDAIRQFIADIGLNQSDITVPIDNLFSINRGLIDAKSNRYFFVPNPIALEVKGVPKTEIRVPLYPGDQSRGVKRYPVEGNVAFFLPKEDTKKLKKDDVFRLKDAFAVKVTEKREDAVIGEFFETQDLSMPKLQWVTGGHIDVEVVMDDNSRRKGYGELAILNEDIDSPMQFERFAYVRLDSKSKERAVCYFTHK
jgi:glutamyl-tRNA synthetase